MLLPPAPNPPLHGAREGGFHHRLHASPTARSSTHVPDYSTHVRIQKDSGVWPVCVHVCVRVRVRVRVCVRVHAEQQG